MFSNIYFAERIGNRLMEIMRIDLYNSRSFTFLIFFVIFMIMTKVCKICDIEKEITEYYKRADSKDGYECWCKKCMDIKSKKYRKDNKEKIKETQRKYRENNKEEIREYTIQYNENNKKQRKEYRENNYEKIRRRTKNYINEKRKIDPLFKLKCILRASINRVLKIRGYKKKYKTFEILGCDSKTVKQHLELQFEPWMNWENHGKYNGEFNYGWDIDHIIPQSSGNTEEELIKLNHYTNFQPLCSKINRDIKRDKRDYYEPLCNTVQNI